jgi:hypothetical protein
LAALPSRCMSVMRCGSAPGTGLCARGSGCEPGAGERTLLGLESGWEADAEHCTPSAAAAAADGCGAHVCIVTPRCGTHRRRGRHYTWGVAAAAAGAGANRQPRAIAAGARRAARHRRPAQRRRRRTHSQRQALRRGRRRGCHVSSRRGCLLGLRARLRSEAAAPDRRRCGPPLLRQPGRMERRRCARREAGTVVVPLSHAARAPDAMLARLRKAGALVTAAAVYGRAGPSVRCAAASGASRVQGLGLMLNAPATRAGCRCMAAELRGRRSSRRTTV